MSALSLSPSMWHLALVIALPSAVSSASPLSSTPAKAAAVAASSEDARGSANEGPARVKPKEDAAPTPGSERLRRLELSFSSAEKFYNQSVYDPTGFVTRRTIPVSTLRPTGEWFFSDQRASLFVAFDLPLEPKVELREGELVETYVSPSLLAGLRASLFSVDVLEETMLELQVEGSLGWLLAPNEVNRLFPSAGWRFHVRDVNGFTLFVGLNFEFRLNVGALIYGVGHRF